MTLNVIFELFCSENEKWPMIIQNIDNHNEAV